MNSQKKEESFEDLKRASELFLLYVEPVMKGIPNSISPEKLATILTLPVAVWNAIAMSQWGYRQDYLGAMYKNLESSPESEKNQSLEVLNFWANRKEELFPDDIWAWELSVFRDLDQKLRIKTDIRIPQELKHLLPTHLRSKKLGLQKIASHPKFRH